MNLRALKVESLVLSSLLLAGCSAAAPLGRPTPAASIAPTTPPVTSSPAPRTQLPPTAAAARQIEVGCSDKAPCKLAAGTWVLSGKYSFILGMTITLPDGWQSLEQDAGEFNLFPIANSGDHIFMVKDIAAVKTDGSLSVVPGVAPTIDGLTGYWQNDPNLTVTQPEPARIAGGLDAVTFVVGVSPNAKFTDRGCPVFPRCADMFTDPRYWGGGVYGIGAPAMVRLYMAKVGSGTNSHLIVVGLEGKDGDALGRLELAAAPILDSITIPAEIVVW